MIKQIFILAICAVFLCACSGNNKPAEAPESNLISEASQISIFHRNGYTQVDVGDPWNKGRLLHTYILVPKDSTLPTDLPKGTIVRTPVCRTLVYSSVHAGVIKDLGCIHAVKGICDAEYFKIPEVIEGLKNGTITNAGSTMAPTIEKVISMKPDAIILSPFQNGGYGTLATIGIPIIECADYMENSPLGRAEWIKFFGLLLGKEVLADQMFNETALNYKALVESASKVSVRPSVLSETPISGVWFVPGGDSYMAHMLMDAGASYPWAERKDSGSLQLDFSQVLATAQNADFWFIKTPGIHSYADLQKTYELNTKFAAFRNKNVWVCDTKATNIFEEFPFHPERLLKEYIAILHPEIVGSDYQLRYFKRLTE